MKKNSLARRLATLLAAALLLACAVPAYAEEMSDQEIIDCVVDNFMLLAAVPRPSHHEEKISTFFMNWAREQGFEPVQDAANNVMFDIPATEGCEGYPLMILQGHMDMVVAIEDGRAFDPLNDPITVLRDDESGTLTADGTSLGADDGSGCAMIMAVAQGKMPHGPVRAIITTDEEDGMEGTFSMDPAWLDGATYLINIDSECSTEVTVSSAAGDSVYASGNTTYSGASGNLALGIQLKGLKGGHSGMEIDKGRLNGVIGLAGFLKAMDGQGLVYQLSTFEGGTAANAIPSKAECVIAVDSGDANAVQVLADAYFGALRQSYAEVEPDLEYALSAQEEVPQVVTDAQSESAVRLITGIVDGVYTMSADIDGLVESSSNLGIFRLNADGVCAVTYLRSSVAELQSEILNAQLQLCEACGYTTDTVKMADAWPYDPDSRLLALTKEIYRAQNGEDIGVEAIHAGLECGTYKALRPDLDLISIGPDLSNVHSIDEVLYLNSLPKVWHLLAALLMRIGE